LKAGPAKLSAEFSATGDLYPDRALFLVSDYSLIPGSQPSASSGASSQGLIPVLHHEPHPRVSSQCFIMSLIPVLHHEPHPRMSLIPVFQPSSSLCASSQGLSPVPHHEPQPRVSS
ncbi:uncharacterized, partial [Tachysurus ichikawai]